MNEFIAACTQRSRTVIIAFLVIIAAGISSYYSIPKEAEPEIDIPFIFVEVTLEGVSPEDAERLLVRPLEQELRTVENVREMVASGGEGRATVTLEFAPDADVDKALTDVRERVDLAKSKLPADAEEPRVSQVKFSRFNPMLVMLLGGNAPERTLFKLSQKLQDEIASVPGVLEVNLVGIREELLEIVIDPLALESYGLSPAEVLNFVESNNRLVAAGAVQGEQGRFAIKVPGVIESPEDVLSLPIKVDQGRVVRFRDIATVQRTFKDSQGYARINGQPAVAIEVVNGSKANVLKTIEEVKALVEQSSQYWPPGITLTYSNDKSFWIKNNISTLMNNVATAVVLVFIVLIGILGIQNSILVGVSIPGSFFVAFFLLEITGMSINMVVLFGMIMAVGMLVDGAIIVTELADRKMMEGMHRREAYTFAAQRMAWPVISSTATTLAAFSPLLLWPGFTGKFLQYMPLTLIYTLTASVFMALIFVPALGAIIGRPGLFNEGIRRNMLEAESGNVFNMTGYTGSYLRFLDRSLNRPWATVGVISVLLVSLYAAYGAFGKGVVLFPDIEPATGSIDIRARGDLSVDEKDKLVRLVEERIQGIEGIDYVYAKSGATGRGAAADLIGSVRLNFSHWRTRRPATEIVEEINQRTSDISGIILEARLRREGQQEGKPIDIELSSPSFPALKDAADRVRGALETIPGVINAEDTRPMPGIEWSLRVDRTEAARFGADVALVGTVIQLVTTGIKVGEYRPDDADTEMDIRVRFPSDKRSLDRLGELRIPTQQGNIPISMFVTRAPGAATRTIMRTDMRRTMLVQADLEKGVLIAPVLEQLQAKIPELGLDATVSYRVKGGAREEEETIAFLIKAFGIAMALIAMILITQFNSIYQTLLILTAVVFSTGGVFLGLLVTNQAFSLINCGIGAIALAGVVVNNNIVLIDTYNILRKEAATAREAVLRTCAQRMRPIMLTTVTTILGLLPMAASLNIDILKREVYFGGPSTQWWKQMASTIAGGLTFATILTMLLTPCLLIIGDNISQRISARRKLRAAEQAAPTPAMQKSAADN